MSKPEADKINPEPTNQTIEVKDLPVKTAMQQEVRGGNGGIQKLGSARLILQGDGNYSG
jgi:hypothetical protein